MPVLLNSQQILGGFIMGKGPLSGVKIIEMAGIGPGPFCAMLLSDMGADIIRIDRKGGAGGYPSTPIAGAASRLRWI